MSPQQRDLSRHATWYGPGRRQWFRFAAGRTCVIRTCIRAAGACSRQYPRSGPRRTSGRVAKAELLKGYNRNPYRETPNSARIVGVVLVSVIFAGFQRVSCWCCVDSVYKIIKIDFHFFFSLYGKLNAHKKRSPAATSCVLKILRVRLRRAHTAPPRVAAFRRFPKKCGRGQQRNTYLIYWAARPDTEHVNMPSKWPFITVSHSACDSACDLITAPTGMIHN